MFPSSASSPSSFSSVFGSSGSHLVQARKLLLQSNSYMASSNKAAAPSMNGHGPSNSKIGQSKFDTDVVMVLSILLCALICALGLNSIIRCALKCSSRGLYVTRDDETVAQLSNTGVKKKALKTFPVVTYLAGSNQPGLDTECVICLSEFNTGERLRVLPKCHHGFHIRCIDKWLMAHSSCPTCRHCLIDTCRKIVGISQASSLEPQSTVSLQGGILPLEHEGFVATIAWFEADSVCGSHSIAIPLVLVFPYICRLFQCLRQHKDTGEKTPLFNALKYLTAVPVIFLSALIYHVFADSWTTIYHPLWILSTVINSMYSFYWDITRDWDFSCPSWVFKFKNPNFFSNLLHGRQWVYYWVVGSNLILRCTWTYKLSAHLRHNYLTVFTIIALEMFLRFQWIFFRVENEANRMILKQSSLLSMSDIPKEEEKLLGSTNHDV